jgi:serine protease AprX
VIVQAEPGGLAGVSDVVEGLGGTVVSQQRALHTAVVDVPSAAVSRLRRMPAVAEVTVDSRVKLHSTGMGPADQPGHLANVATTIGAPRFWREGYTGQGVDVALLDTGVLPVEGLMTPNKLVIGPDLSFEAQLPTLAGLDTFGHGTHLAGIIAGRDAGPAHRSDDDRFTGMAPGARIVSLKLADARGNTDVSQVIAGIDWVVEHAHDKGLNIRVLNLAFGTDSTQDYRLDPLAHAAEVAWSKGIVVVVSAGNGGTARAGLTNPAFAPAVLAVGAQDTRGTEARDDDAVAAFSQRGAQAAGRRGPDLVAPGVSVLSLRAPGSFIDTRFGATAAVGERFFKGSGTSQSTAVVAGAAALLLSQRPELTPDQVKDVLRRSADPLAGTSSDAQGAGAVDLATAYSTPARSVAVAVPQAGGGSIHKARGRYVVTRNGVPLAGEQDVFGRAVDTRELARAEHAGRAFRDGRFVRGKGSSPGWTGPPAAGARWTGATWAGATWAGATWAGATWAGATWAGATWAGATWAGATWAGATWAGATWAGATWAGATWAGEAWAGQVWE